MLPKENRLTTRFEFNKVYYLSGKQNTKCHGKLLFILCAQPENYTGPTRFGIVISKKISKSAVKRNRIRRIFREIIRENLDKIKDNYWVVIHPKLDCLDASYEEISADFNKILQKCFLTR